MRSVLSKLTCAVLVLLSMLPLSVQSLAQANTEILQMLPIGKLFLASAILAEKAALPLPTVDPQTGRPTIKKTYFPMAMCAFPGGLCGAIDRDGKVVVPPNYDWVDEFSEGRALVRSKGFYGFVDEQGKEIATPKFENAGRFANGIALFDADGKMGAIDSQGQIAIEPKYAYLGRLPNDLFLTSDERQFAQQSSTKISKNGGITVSGVPSMFLSYSSDFKIHGRNSSSVWAPKGKLELIDQSSRRVGEALIRELKAFDRLAGWPIWAKSDIAWGLLKADGKWLVEPRFDEVRELTEGLAAVAVKGRWGFVGADGAIRIEPRFEQVDWADRGAIGFTANGRRGLLDMAGNITVDPKYSYVRPFDGEVALARIESKWGLIERSGRWRVEPRFDQITSAYPWKSKNLLVVELDRKSGLMTPHGDVIIEPRFSQAPQVCDNGRIIGYASGNWHLLDATGKPIVPERGELQWPSNCSGPYTFKYDGKFGRVDSDMREISPPIYDSIKPGAAQIGKKWGLLNADGTWAVEPSFDAVESIGDGRALVHTDGKIGLMRLKDRAWLASFQDGEICAMSERLILHTTSNRRQLLDRDGNTVLDAPVNRLSLKFDDGLLLVQANNLWGFVDLTGRAVIDAKYDTATTFKRGIAWVKSGNSWCPIDRRGDRVNAVACEPIDPDEGSMGRAECKIR